MFLLDVLQSITGQQILRLVLLPFLVELVQVVPRLLYEREFKSFVALEIAVPVAILIGGFVLRYIIVVAGQITAPATL